MSGFTPGPWHSVPSVHADRRNFFGPGHHIGTLVSGSKRKLDLFEANCRLIDAAPALYAALQALRNECGGTPRPDYLLPLLAQADAALSSASPSLAGGGE